MAAGSTHQAGKEAAKKHPQYLAAGMQPCLRAIRVRPAVKIWGSLNHTNLLLISKLISKIASKYLKLNPLLCIDRIQSLRLSETQENTRK